MKEKITYEQPLIEIILFDVDVLTDSSGVQNNTDSSLTENTPEDGWI